MCSTFSNVGTLLGRNGGVYVALRAARPLTVEEVAGHTTGPVPSRGHNLELASAREGAGKVGVARHRSTKLFTKLQCDFVGSTQGQTLTSNLDRQTQTFPTSEAHGHNCHTLFRGCFFSVPVGTLRCTMCGVLASENYQ